MNAKMWMNVVGMGLCGLLLAMKPAHAGQEGHGGKVIFCEGKEPVVQDYYQAALPDLTGRAPELIDLSGKSFEETMMLLRKQMGLFGLFVEQFDRAGSGWVDDFKKWKGTSLRNTPDSAEPYPLPEGCRLAQAAVRQGKTMYGDPGVINLLSPAQKAILIAHEKLYLLASEHGRQTSVEVRVLMEQLLRKDYQIDTMSEAILSIGGNAAKEIGSIRWVESKTFENLCKSSRTYAEVLESWRLGIREASRYEKNFEKWGLNAELAAIRTLKDWFEYELKTYQKYDSGLKTVVRGEGASKGSDADFINTLVKLNCMSFEERSNRRAQYEVYQRPPGH